MTAPQADLERSLRAETEDTLRDWASAHHGACHVPGDAGYCEPDAASWGVEVLTPAHFSHVFESQEAARQWIDNEIQMAREDGLERGWNVLLVEDIREEIYCLMVDEQAHIWDGWHRAAACVATNRSIVAVVGRPLPAPDLRSESVAERGAQPPHFEGVPLALRQVLAAKSAIAEMAPLRDAPRLKS